MIIEGRPAAREGRCCDIQMSSAAKIRDNNKNRTETQTLHQPPPEAELFRPPPKRRTEQGGGQRTGTTFTHTETGRVNRRIKIHTHTHTHAQTHNTQKQTHTCDSKKRRMQTDQEHDGGKLGWLKINEQVSGMGLRVVLRFDVKRTGDSPHAAMISKGNQNEVVGESRQRRRGRGEGRHMADRLRDEVKFGGCGVGEMLLEIKSMGGHITGRCHC